MKGQHLLLTNSLTAKDLVTFHNMYRDVNLMEVRVRNFEIVAILYVSSENLGNRGMHYRNYCLKIFLSSKNQCFAYCYCRICFLLTIDENNLNEVEFEGIISSEGGKNICLVVDNNI